MPRSPHKPIASGRNTRLRPRPPRCQAAAIVRPATIVAPRSCQKPVRAYVAAVKPSCSKNHVRPPTTIAASTARNSPNTAIAPTSTPADPGAGASPGTGSGTSAMATAGARRARATSVAMPRAPTPTTMSRGTRSGGTAATGARTIRANTGSAAPSSSTSTATTGTTTTAPRRMGGSDSPGRRDRTGIVRATTPRPVAATSEPARAA